MQRNPGNLAEQTPFILEGHPLTYMPSPNHSPRPAGEAVALIVLHATGGNFRGALSWMCARGSGVSAHFLIARDGRIVQLVPLARAAWHAGVSAWNGREGVNACSIGIELEHLDGVQDWPAMQLDAAERLVRALLAAYDLPAERVVGHAAVARPPGRKVDPVAFPWDAFRARLTGASPIPPGLRLHGQRIAGQLIRQTLFIPARALCEALGWEACWDPQTRELRVTNEKGAQP